MSDILTRIVQVIAFLAMAGAFFGLVASAVRARKRRRAVKEHDARSAQEKLDEVTRTLNGLSESTNERYLELVRQLRTIVRRNQPSEDEAPMVFLNGTLLHEGTSGDYQWGDGDVLRFNMRVQARDIIQVRGGGRALSLEVEAGIPVGMPLPLEEAQVVNTEPPVPPAGFVRVPPDTRVDSLITIEGTEHYVTEIVRQVSSGVYYTWAKLGDPPVPKQALDRILSDDEFV